MEPVKHQMERARRRREAIQQGRRLSDSDRQEPPLLPPTQPGKKRASILQGNTAVFLTGMVLIVAALFVGWRFMTDQAFRDRLVGPVPSGAEHAGNPADVVSTDSSISRPAAVIADLNKRVDILTASISHLESKLIRAHVITDSILASGQRQASSSVTERPLVAEAARIVDTLPPPAAGQAAVESELSVDHASVPTSIASEFQGSKEIDTAEVTDSNSLPQQDGVLPESPPSAVSPAPVNDTATAEHSGIVAMTTEADSDTALTGDQGEGSRTLTASSETKVGPWLINLASSPSKADAEQFMEKALSKGIYTEEQQAIVKGKLYWRVRITGFSTEEEARAHANTVMEKLDLQEVWITRR